jgi:hypothetical protein
MICDDGTPRAGLIFERPREGRCEERTFLAHILPDRGFDVSASQRVRWFLLVAILFTPLLK